jgi:hypothetical protein
MASATKKSGLAPIDNSLTSCIFIMVKFTIAMSQHVLDMGRVDVHAAVLFY